MHHLHTHRDESRPLEIRQPLSVDAPPSKCDPPLRGIVQANTFGDIDPLFAKGAKGIYVPRVIRLTMTKTDTLQDTTQGKLP